MRIPFVLNLENPFVHNPEILFVHTKGSLIIRSNQKTSDGTHQPPAPQKCQRQKTRKRNRIGQFKKSLDILENMNNRCKYFGNSSRIQNRVFNDAIPTEPSRNSCSKKFSQVKFNSGRDRFIAPKTSQYSSTGNAERIYFNNFFSSEKIRMDASNYKFETIEQFCGDNSLQNGNSSDSIEPTSRWRFSSECGSKSAYFNIPIHQQHRKYLRFLWKSQRYEFQCLPFGLKSAPRIFTKCTKPIMSALRSHGHRGIIYIDDSLWMGRSVRSVEETGFSVVNLFQQAGFQINEEKSSLLPTQSVTFLGYVMDTVKMTVSLPQEKVQQILKEIQNLLLQAHPKI